MFVVVGLLGGFWLVAAVLGVSSLVGLLVTLVWDSCYAMLLVSGCACLSFVIYCGVGII